MFANIREDIHLQHNFIKTIHVHFSRTFYEIISILLGFTEIQNLKQLTV